MTATWAAGICRWLEGTPQPPGMGGVAPLAERFEAMPPLRRPTPSLPYLGWTPGPPQAGVPGSQKMVPSHGPCRVLQPPPGLDPRPPQAGAPGSWKVMAPHRP